MARKKKNKYAASNTPAERAYGWHYAGGCPFCQKAVESRTRVGFCPICHKRLIGVMWR